MGGEGGARWAQEEERIGRGRFEGVYRSCLRERRESRSSSKIDMKIKTKKKRREGGERYHQRG